MTEEIDMPTILGALEEAFKDFKEKDDFSSFTKAELANNIQIMFDAMIDMAKYMVVLGHKIDIIDKAIGQVVGLKAMMEEMEGEENDRKPEFYM